MFDAEYPGSVPEIKPALTKRRRLQKVLDAHIQDLIDIRMSAIEKNIEKLISKGLDKDKLKEKEKKTIVKCGE